MIDQAAENFLQDHVGEKFEISKLAGDAGAREYYRITGTEPQYVFCDSRPVQQTIKPFCVIQKILRDLGLRVPHIYEAEKGFMLLEDLGDINLSQRFDAKPENQKLYLEKCIASLAHLHKQTVSPPAYFEMQVYDQDLFIEQASLFCQTWLPLIYRDSSTLLEAQSHFMALYKQVAKIACSGSKHLMLRDFFLGNIMWLPREENFQKACIIDFQDAGIGPVFYDVISLLQDARRDIPQDLEAEMIEYYCKLSDTEFTDTHRQQYAALGVLRHTRILSVFIRLAVLDKTGYLEFLPRVWKQLENSIAALNLMPLTQWFDKYIPVENRTQPELSAIQAYLRKDDFS